MGNVHVRRVRVHRPVWSGGEGMKGGRAGRPAASRRTGQQARAMAHDAGLARRADATDDLRPLLDATDPAVVATGLWALGRLRDRELLMAAVARLDATNARVARAAIWATGQIGGVTAARALAAHLGKGPGDLQTALLVALDHLPRQQAIAAVLPLLHDPDGSVRSRVSQALIRWGAESAEAVRTHLRAGGGFPDTATDETRSEQVQDTPRGVVSPSGAPDAVLSLETIRLQHPPTCLRACAYVLSSTMAHAPDNEGWLIQLASSDDTRTRLHAIAGLAHAVSGEARTVLTRLLDDPRRDIQEAALAALLAAPATALELDEVRRRLAAEDRPHLRALFFRLASAQSAPSEDTDTGLIEGTPSTSPTYSSLVPPHSRLLIVVVPGLEEIATAEMAVLGGVTVCARYSGLLVVTWETGGLPAQLAALRTVEEVLLDAGAVQPDGSVDLAMLNTAITTFARLHSQTGAPASAYIRVRPGIAQRDTLRMAGGAALQRLGVAVHSAIDQRRAPITVEYVPVETGQHRRKTAEAQSAAPYRLGVRLLDAPGRRPLPAGGLPASLNATVAAAMICLLEPPGGEVFLDPLCGAGTLLRERAVMGPEPTMLLGGDQDPMAVARAQANLADWPVHLHTWDAGALPLDAASVDMVACNPPYGHRTGAHAENTRLYPRMIGELHRVVRPGGRVAVITQEKTLIQTALRGHGLHIRAVLEVAVGGLTPSIYLIERH